VTYETIEHEKKSVVICDATDTINKILPRRLFHYLSAASLSVCPSACKAVCGR